MTEETLFHDALSRPAAERAAFLDAACAGQPELRAAVEALLAAHEASGSLLDRPAAELGQTVDPQPGQARPVGTGEYTPQPGNAPSEVAATTDSCRSIEPGVVIAGRYVLQEKIGEGGMGEVWVAKQTEPVKRRVALKLIKTGMDSKAVLTRFEQERQALAMMDHPNIASVLDGGLDLVSEPRTLGSGLDHPLTSVRGSGMPFFVMELVNGLPLTRFCDEARLTPRERLELFVPICQAVQHAHQKGIVHRDLKPSNILVTLIDGKPIPKVIDFGVAKATGGKLTDESLSTQFGAIVGTLEYMSPEQAGFSGVDVDTRADIYSLGVILYELLTGLRPIDAKRLRQAAYAEMMRIIQEEEPSKPSTRLSIDAALPSLAAARQIEPKKLMALLRGELDWVVMKCLEKSRERRYETVNGLARDIQRYLADEPVEARPPSAGYRLGKFLKRNKGTVVAAGVVLVALLAGIVGTTIGLVRAMKAEEVARKRFEEAEAARANAAASARAETEQRQKAEKAEADTLADYRASTDDAIEQLIGSKPELGPKEKRYLENTLKRWQAFAGRLGDDERSRAIRAEGHYSVALLWQKLGHRNEARAAYEAARFILKQMVRKFPDIPNYQQKLADTHNNLGVLLNDLGRNDEARTEYLAARDLKKKLTEQFPNVAEYQEDLTRIHNNLGILLAGLGKREEALAEFQTARGIQKKLTEQFPAAPVHRQVLATTQNNLGRLLADLGQREEGRAEYRLSRDIQKKLVEQFPSIPEYQRDLAITHNNLGQVLADLENRKEARVEYEAARDIRKKLVEQFPAVPVFKRDLAMTHNNLGNLLADLGMSAEAQAEHQAACNIRKKLIEQFPAVPTYQHDLAVTHNNLGFHLANAGKPEEARTEYEAASEIQKKLVAQFPAVPQYQEELANTHNNLGKLFNNLGKGQEARVEFQAACNLWKKLAEQFPAVTTYQIMLGGGYCNYGIVMRCQCKPAESLRWFNLAVQTLQLLHEKEPRNMTCKENLLGSHFGRAQTYDLLKKPVEANKDWERAIELSPRAERPGIRANRATSRIQTGMVAEAVAEVAELTKDLNWDAGQWYAFACVYALASGKSADKKQAYADQAMELLGKAVKAGYKDAAQMKKDTDLDPLRKRDDFKKLLAELEKKSATRPEKQP